jgi:hypothetical protein
MLERQLNIFPSHQDTDGSAKLHFVGVGSSHRRAHCVRPLQVAVELLRLAAEHGVESWRGPTIAGKPINIKGVGSGEWATFSAAERHVQIKKRQNCAAA